MITSKNGFILFMTLGFIAIINLLLLASMQYVLLYYKVTNQEQIQQHRFYQLEAVAIHLIKHHDKTCIEYNDLAHQVMNNLMNNQGCEIHYAQVNYRYTIEELGEFPCIQVMVKNKAFSTHHIRISVLITADGTNAASFLQLRYIAPTTFCQCDGTVNLVNFGISSWRYLPDL